MAGLRSTSTPADACVLRPPMFPTQVITSAEFHPLHCHMFAYSSSKGCIRLADLRSSALIDHKAKVFEESDSQVRGWAWALLAGRAGCLAAAPRAAAAFLAAWRRLLAPPIRTLLYSDPATRRHARMHPSRAASHSSARSSPA